MNLLFKYRPLIFAILLNFFNTVFGDPLYLNNANPFPIFSSQGRYDYLTRASRDKIKEFIFNGEDINGQCDNDKIFHANLMPYTQTASHGTDYLGNSKVTLYNNKNMSAIAIDSTNIIQDTMPQGNPQQGAPNQNATANLFYSVPMPLGAIPEPFNFFALFYMNNPMDPIEPQVYKTGALLEAEYDFIKNSDEDALILAQAESAIPSDSGNFNQVAKVVARYLGMNDTPAFLLDTTNDGKARDPNSIGIVKPSPLMYDYSNYKNNYFGLLQYPSSRDPQKLFGYGYFKSSYQKIGIRGTFEWKINNYFGLKIYTGFSNLDIDNINVLDTTINYQGPNGALMLSRYPDPIYQLSNNNSPQAPTPYIQPNIYQLTDYSTPIMDNTSNALFNNNFYNSSELQNYLPDEFKTAFLQNIQYNIDTLGQLINQNFRPYSVQSFDDTTFELFYRRLIVYNKPHKRKKDDSNLEEDKLNHIPYTLLPTAAIHVTCPIAPRVPANKIFGKPLDNNGHWELGANLGLEFDFINNIVIGADVGFSWYNESIYTNVPIPTNQFNEGIYLYSANLTKIPGYSYTFGCGMQVDELFDCIDFFTEYRVVRHAEDNFMIQSINNLLPIKYMENTHTTPPPDDQEALDTIPNGILYLNYNQRAPYPDRAIIEHMKEVSSWIVHLINLTVNYKINTDMSLGLAWQQPFLLKNAYNASTLGISFEMYL
jgi:hypothetical protein